MLAREHRSTHILNCTKNLKKKLKWSEMLLILGKKAAPVIETCDTKFFYNVDKTQNNKKAQEQSKETRLTKW